MGEAVIEIKGLSQQIGQRFLLRDLNWTVEKGEQWVVFGMNGCGKTTLLSILAGFLQQTSGEVRMLQEEYRAENIFALRKRIGFVSSSFFGKLFLGESLLQIVLSGCCGGLGVDGQVHYGQVHQAKQLLRALHLEQKQDYPFRVLSKGEQQNVLIARALISEPEIILLDELTSGLDVVARSYMEQTIQALIERTGVTVVNVTHYPEEISSVFTKCMLLKEGNIYAMGTVSEMLAQEQLEGFLCHPVVKYSQAGQLLRLQAVVAHGLEGWLPERGEGR